MTKVVLTRALARRMLYLWAARQQAPRGQRSKLTLLEAACTLPTGPQREPPLSSLIPDRRFKAWNERVGR